LDPNDAAGRAWALRINLMRVAMSILHHGADAEDAVSTAMAKAIQGAGNLSDEAKFNAWLMRTLVRTCYDMLRLRKRETVTCDAAAFERPVFDNTEGSVWEMLRQVPAAYQKVLTLHYYEGFKAREIGHILSMPLGTVLVNLSRGRKALKRLIMESEGVTQDDQ